jgi:hypothetical protein
LVVSRDVLRGEPRWVEGVGFDFDTDFWPGTGRTETDFFVWGAMLEGFLPEWTPDRGIATCSWGWRIRRGSVGGELRAEYRFAEDDPSMFGFYVGVVVRDRMEAE